MAKKIENNLEESKINTPNLIKVRVGDHAKYNEMMKKVNSGELKWSFYAIDNDKYYYYFEKLKK